MYSGTLQLAVVGMSHKSSGISDRELFQLNKNEITETLKYFNSIKGVEGIIVISTCNRLEFYFVIEKNVTPFSLVNDFYIKKKNIDAKSKIELFYQHFQTDAVRHLFHVVSGLDSMLIGEYQIQGQIKEAYGYACSEKSAEKILHKLFHAAFRVGKKIRSQTKIGSGKQSLSGIAYKLIKENLTTDDVITIIGVNQNTKIIADQLYISGYTNLIFINRTRYKAEELANKYHGTVYSIDKMEIPIANSKCVFSCTGSQEFVVKSTHLKKANSISKHDTLLIDMAIPRDIETEDIPEEMKVYDLEGLKNYLDEQIEINSLDYPLAEEIISEEVNEFEDWTESQMENILDPFADRIESIRLQLLEESKSNFSEEEFKILNKFSNSLIHRMKSTFNQAVRVYNSKQKREN